MKRGVPRKRTATEKSQKEKRVELKNVERGRMEYFQQGPSLPGILVVFRPPRKISYRHFSGFEVSFPALTNMGELCWGGMFSHLSRKSELNPAHSLLYRLINQSRVNSLPR